MKNIPIHFLFLAVVVFVSCKENSTTRENNTPKTTVARHDLTALPDYYMFAFQSSQTCGIDFMTPENVNKVIQAYGGAEFANVFCCRTNSGYRVFTARHVFIPCPDNPNLKVENYDVASLPFDAISGFEIAKPEENSIVAIKGFRITDDGAEWLEIKGQMMLGTLSDLSPQFSHKPTWNPGKVWLIKADDTGLNYENLPGLSGAPVFNSGGKVVACFSGIYTVKDGNALANGTYLRLEALQK